MDASSPLSSAEGVVELDSFPRGSFVCPFLLRSLFEPSLWEAKFLASEESKEEFFVAVFVGWVEGAVVGSSDQSVVVEIPGGLCVEITN